MVEHEITPLQMQAIEAGVLEFYITCGRDGWLNSLGSTVEEIADRYREFRKYGWGYGKDSSDVFDIIYRILPAEATLKHDTP